MTLAIMQPYFFPYVGYFQLIAAAPAGVVFDIVKYNRKSWMNRNRVLHPREGWQYVSVPVDAPHGALIKDAALVDRQAAHARIRGQLEHYRRHAPFFHETVAVLDRTFEAPSTTIAELATRSLAEVCAYLHVPFEWSVCSAMNLDLPPIEHAGQWALEIADRLGAKRYLNTMGGRDIFVPEEWIARKIELRFIDPTPYRYATGPYAFVEGLSILDVLMWNPPEAVRAHLYDTLDRALA